METRQGILLKTEKVIENICLNNPNYRYKINKINIIVYHTSERSAIIDIYGRIKNSEIRVNISSDSPEYQIYLSQIKKDVDLNRIKTDVKGKLNYSFYLSEGQIKNGLEQLLSVRE